MPHNCTPILYLHDCHNDTCFDMAVIFIFIFVLCFCIILGQVLYPIGAKPCMDLMNANK